MKKNFIKVLAIGLCMAYALSYSNAYASEKETSNPYETVVSQVSVSGTSENLYKEFLNQDLAFKQFLSDYEGPLYDIAIENNIDKLNKGNWQEYKDIVQGAYLDHITDPTYRKMNSFFDIYENKGKNDAIKEKLSKHDLSELEYLLPLQSTYVSQKLNRTIDLDKVDFSTLARIKELGITSKATSLPNMKAAIAYAEKHATDPNTKHYHKFNSDCTNFVSQILEAGGIKQVVYSDEYKGWWHTTGNWHIPFIGSEHKHSRAWAVADVFARYMGVGSTTTNHKRFSTLINKGTIIAYDGDSDGDWDHVAFVTAADDYIGSYGYYDYKVAQHTRDYHAWTSTSVNNWEYIGSNGGTYALIRQ